MTRPDLRLVKSDPSPAERALAAQDAAHLSASVALQDALKALDTAVEAIGAVCTLTHVKPGIRYELTTLARQMRAASNTVHQLAGRG